MTDQQQRAPDPQTLIEELSRIVERLESLDLTVAAAYATMALDAIKCGAE